LSSPNGATSKKRFHPLKAGRRQHLFDLIFCPPTLFPSPQGGSETKGGDDLGSTPYVSIPSRRVGDIVVNGVTRETSRVSIPSRRVGDSQALAFLPVLYASFHPLKAGRRLGSKGGTPSGTGKFPSPQGGSETERMAKVKKKLKFPSPQGGSETLMTSGTSPA